MCDQLLVQLKNRVSKINLKKSSFAAHQNTPFQLEKHISEVSTGSFIFALNKNFTKMFYFQWWRLGNQVSSIFGSNKLGISYNLIKLNLHFFLPAALPCLKPSLPCRMAAPSPANTTSTPIPQTCKGILTFTCLAGIPSGSPKNLCVKYLMQFILNREKDGLKQKGWQYPAAQLAVVAGQGVGKDASIFSAGRNRGQYL